MPVFAINGKSVLFIHIPKTGGTTVEKVLSQFGSMSLHSNGNCLKDQFRGGWLSKPVPLQHLHGALLRRLILPDQFDLVFMLVRDPVQRMLSEYRHSRELGRPEALLSFSVWLQISLRLVRSDPAFRNNHFRAQADYHIEGARVLHFEDGMLPCLNEISAALDIPKFEELPHERRSRTYAAEPSPRDIERIQEDFAADYEMFPRYRTGGTYNSPPAFHSALIPRSMPSFEPLPRLRSNISA
ncbi:MAG TPA: sulfotransferase family 2 domain-containing protein [Aestuariivirga sp.]|nr:sulfotransferase family 2 domain-containing protein [Aestuariivirga sp.]